MVLVGSLTMALSIQHNLPNAVKLTILAECAVVGLFTIGVMFGKLL
jgi:hypothetical protein